MLKINIDTFSYICYICNFLNKNQFFAVKILQLFKQKLIPCKYTDDVNNENLKPAWEFHMKSNNRSRACAY